MQQTDELIKLSDPGEVGREEHTRADRFAVAIGNVFAWVFPILMLAICAQVVLRSSGFNQAWLDDLQWWLYGSSALIAVGYAVTTTSHVRVDIFHENFPERKKVRIEIFALAWLFMPFVILAWDITIPYALQSIRNDEGSSSPNGLHNLWILKTFMNVAFIFIFFATWSAYVRFLSKIVKPTLWRQMLYALPSTIFLVNLVIYYTIWWALRLTTPAEVSDRDIGRHWLFETFEIGPEEMKWTVLFALIGTVILIGAARALDRSAGSET